MTLDKKQELNNYQVSALVSALDNTGVRLFLYYPQTKIITVPDNACEAYQCKPVYENMPQSFADDFVLEDDHKAFNEMYYRIDRGEKTATAIFHSQDLNFCHHVTLTTVSWMENGEPSAAVGIIEDISKVYKSENLVQSLQKKLLENIQEDDSVQEAMNRTVGVISDSYRTIYYIWLEDMTYVSFQDEIYNRAESFGNRVPVNQKMTALFVEKNVEAVDQERVLRFFAVDTVSKRMQETDRIECKYRRVRFGWTAAQYIVVKRDEDGKASQVIFLVSDINEEVVQEEKKRRTEFELYHDPLTKVYNRKAFEELENAGKNSGDIIGFAIVDVDNFKMVNDTFGHEMGDKVLVEAAELLTSTFRADDTVFRIGGDEFAVLLRHCKPVIWEAFCDKQHRIHEELDRRFKNTAVTFSIGMAFSATGYDDKVYREADKRLYEVKSKGRAGAAMIDLENGDIRYWRDDTLSYKAQNVLEYNNTGLYRIEYPMDTSRKPRLICGDMTRGMFGFSKELSPEECYQMWVDNVDSSYIEILGETRRTLFEGNQAECTYQWNHPTLGKVFVRTGGSGEIKDDVQILHGYHHLMVNTKIMERKDDKQLLFDAVSAIYFCSYYIDMVHDSFYTLKNAPGERYLEIQEDKATDAIRQFVSGLVSQEDRMKMTAFMDLKTLPERLKNESHLDCGYRSTTDKGRCRATFFPVKYDADGRLLTVLFAVTSLNEAD